LAEIRLKDNFPDETGNNLKKKWKRVPNSTFDENSTCSDNPENEDLANPAGFGESWEGNKADKASEEFVSARGLPSGRVPESGSHQG
jgi:hypothetical protein